jgi:Tol biopolymer transport system component
MKRFNYYKLIPSMCIILYLFSNLLYAAPGDIEIVSKSNSGNLGVGSSFYPSISSDGRYVAFESVAYNLVPNDKLSGETDIFVFDRKNKTIKRVSISNNGIEANGSNSNSSISFNGQFIAFESKASNLITNDTNNTWDIFVYDIFNNKIECITMNDFNGEQGNVASLKPSISADGNFVAFESGATNLVPNYHDTKTYYDIFVFNRKNKIMELVSISNNGNEANGNSYNASISYDGRYIAFESKASNLVENDTNNIIDVFVFDKYNKQMERVSVSNNGIEGNKNSTNPSISFDGRFIAFESNASNLVPNDTNDKIDIFVFDRYTKKIERVSIANDGTQSNENCYEPSISSDGRYIAFETYASNLVPNDTNNRNDIFVYDRYTKKIERISSNNKGIQGNHNSFRPSISSNGKFVAFESNASNLIEGDNNNVYDIFVKERKISSNFNAYRLILNVPYFSFSGRNYWLDLKLIKSNPIQFKLDSFGENPNMTYSSYSATFNSNNKILHIPDFYLNGKTYLLNLELTSTNPIIFTLINYEENR